MPFVALGRSVQLYFAEIIITLSGIKTYMLDGSQASDEFGSRPHAGVIEIHDLDGARWAWNRRTFPQLALK